MRRFAIMVTILCACIALLSCSSEQKKAKKILRVIPKNYTCLEACEKITLAARDERDTRDGRLAGIRRCQPLYQKYFLSRGEKVTVEMSYDQKMKYAGWEHKNHCQLYYKRNRKIEGKVIPLPKACDTVCHGARPGNGSHTTTT